jgi:hypothetical protein
LHIAIQKWHNVNIKKETFDNEIEKGFNDLLSGRPVSAEKVAERITKEYGHEL